MIRKPSPNMPKLIPKLSQFHVLRALPCKLTTVPVCAVARLVKETFDNFIGGAAS